MTTKHIRKSITPVIKICTEAIIFLGHANQEAGSKKRKNIAMSLPKALYSLTEDVLIPSERLFGGEINAMINNIYVKQKVFKVNKTYFKQKGMEYDCHNLYEISSISNEKPSISIKIQKSK